METSTVFLLVGLESVLYVVMGLTLFFCTEVFSTPGGVRDVTRTLPLFLSSLVYCKKPRALEKCPCWSGGWVFSSLSKFKGQRKPWMNHLIPWASMFSSVNWEDWPKSSLKFLLVLTFPKMQAFFPEVYWQVVAKQQRSADMLLANIIFHLFAVSWWKIITGKSSVFWCLLWEKAKRTQEERSRNWRGWVPPMGIGMVPFSYDVETDTEKPTEGWSQCLEDEYYISEILLSVLISAEVIAVILFSVCCWQCCMANWQLFNKNRDHTPEASAIFTRGQCSVSMSRSTHFLKS